MSASANDIAFRNPVVDHRNKTVAKSFYRQLRTEGFTHEQIIDLSTRLLDMVSEDIRSETTLNS